jgi:cytochrome c-type biogenesis protein
VDVDSLRLALEHAGIAAVVTSFLAGLVFSFNPVAMAAIPVSLAYVTKARTSRQAFVFAAMFILGMIVIHVVLGLVAGFGGLGVQKLLDRKWGVLIGPVLIVLGLMWPGWLRIPLPAFTFKVKRPNSSFGAFLLGIPFSIAICPICTPALAVLLGVVASLGSPWFGALLLLAFALGRAVPLAVGAWSLGWLENLRFVSAYRRVFEIAGAATLIATGLYMLNAYFFWLPALAS